MRLVGEGRSKCGESLVRWVDKRLSEVFGVVAVQEVGVRLPTQELGMLQYSDKESPVGCRAMDVGSPKGRRQNRSGTLPGGSMGYDLGDHRVVVDRYLRTVLDPGVDPQPIGRRYAEPVELTGDGEKIV